MRGYFLPPIDLPQATKDSLATAGYSTGDISRIAAIYQNYVAMIQQQKAKPAKKYVSKQLQSLRVKLSDLSAALEELGDDASSFLTVSLQNDLGAMVKPSSCISAMLAACDSFQAKGRPDNKAVKALAWALLPVMSDAGKSVFESSAKGGARQRSDIHELVALLTGKHHDKAVDGAISFRNTSPLKCA